eukprot:COSAG01_NODE_13266_length_1610_cov_1.538054_2_plen_286_part_00
MLKYPLAYWPLHIFLYCLVKTLPYKSLQYLGEKLGILAKNLLKERYNITYQNIKKAYPQKKESEITALSTAHFQALGQGIMEILMAWFYSRKALKKHTSISGLEHVDPNHGAILLSGHFTHVEIASRIIGLHVNDAKQSGVLYIPTKNKTTEALISNHRIKYLKAIPYDKPLMGLRHLKEKKWLFILPDQNMNHAKRSSKVNFLNQPFYGINSCSELAKRCNSKVYPCFCHKQNGQYHIKIEAAFKNIPSNNIQNDTQLIFDKIEKEINKNPKHYFWIHQLFKKK